MKKYLLGTLALSILLPCSWIGASSVMAIFSASRLADLMAIDTSATVQTLGQNCSTVSPCVIRIGAVSFTLTAPVTATLSGVSSTANVYWYFSSATSQIIAGHNSAATLTCAGGCAVATGITAFPPDSIPLWQTSFTANLWGPVVPATMDKRAVYLRDVIAAGTGLSLASDPSTGIQTLSATSVFTSLTAFQNYGYNGGGAGLAVVANTTQCTGIIFNGAKVGHLVLFIALVDAVNNTDVGIYNAAGTLLGNIGAQTVATDDQSLAFVQGTITLPSGPGYYCWTSSASTLQLAIWAANTNSSFFSTGSVSSVTSGGALNSSITPPSPVRRGAVTVPIIMLLP